MSSSEESSDFEEEQFNGDDNFDVEDSSDEDSNEGDDGVSATSNKNLKRKATTELSGENKKLKKKGKYNIPSIEELSELQDEDDLSKTNIFLLQAEEYFKKIKIKNKQQNEIHSYQKKLQDFLLKNMDQHPQVSSSEIIEFGKNKTEDKKENKCEFMQYLYENRPDFQSDVDVALKFVRPENISKLDDFCFDMKIDGICHTNLVATMPSDLFKNKDYFNYRYSTIRYYYILYIAYELFKNKQLCEDVAITYYNGIKYVPILNVTPAACSKTKLQIHFVPKEDTFKLSRFVPQTKNVKSKDIVIETGTPLYNSAIAYDLTLNKNAQFIKPRLEDHEEITKSIKFLKMWLRNRSLNTIVGGFTDEILMHTMCYLLDKAKVTKHMNVYQVMRNFWNFIWTTDWTKEPIGGTSDHMDQFKKHFEVVLIDSTEFYNVAAFFIADIYLKVKSEAGLALKCLNEGNIDAFESLVVKKKEGLLSFDAILNVVDSEQFEEINKKSQPEETFQYNGFQPYFVIKKLSDLLKKGLNKRICHLVPVIPAADKKSIKISKVLFGINLNPEHAFNQLEMGPQPHDPAAEEFRSFWEELASLRRFKDGTICEAVNFEAKTIQEKRHIFAQIIDFIFNKKINLGYRLLSDQLEDVIKLQKFIPPFEIGTNEEPSLVIKSAYDKLSNILRELEMPLPITAVQGISDVFSYTDVFPPIPTNYKAGKKITNSKDDYIILRDDGKPGMLPRYLAAVECVIQLAQHSKWPNDVNALRAMFTEFYFTFADALKKKHNLLTKVTDSYIDVFYEGLIFRFKIYQPKEIHLVKQVINANGVVSYKDNKESIALEKKLDYIPKIQGALNGVHLQHSCYGPSTAIIKRWLRSHLLDDYHISDVAINLLNAHLFLKADSADMILPQFAFMRFLTFMVETDFNLNMIVVNFNQLLKRDEIKAIELEFQKSRQKYPHLCIITPYDERKSSFTTHNPSLEVLKRISVLASITSKYLSSCVSEATTPMIKGLFYPTYEGYNLLIHIKPLLNPRRHQHVSFESNHDTVFSKFSDKENKKMPIVDFNPVHKYLETLRNNYGQFAHFFHDTYGGNVIGVLWIPSAIEPMPFRPSAVHARKLEGDKLVFNMDAVIEDFYTLGADLVKNIEQF